ncbi:hypothetical protein [Streptomyces sp. NPDC002758]
MFWLVRWDSGASFPAVTAPSGAVLRGTIATGTVQTLCYLLRVSAESSFAYSWTGTRWSALAAQFFSGVDPALNLSLAPFQSATGAGAPVSTLTVTTVSAAALAWHVNTIDTESGITHTPPTGYTETADVAPWSTAYLISPGTGSQSASGATFSPSQMWAAGLVALAPAASGATGDAALAGTATLSATGLRAAAGSSALAATATLSTSGVRATAGTAALTSTASLAASGQTAAVGSATLTAAATLSAAGQRATTTVAGLAATAALTAQGQVAHSGATALTATATLTADGTTGTPPGNAALSVAATLAAAGTTVAAGNGALVATATLTAGGTTISSRDDIDITVGMPYSPWAVSEPKGEPRSVDAPKGEPWSASEPQAIDWEVATPW